MTKADNMEESDQPPKFKSVAEFLESSPPNHPAVISDLADFKHIQNFGASDVLHTPEIQLHCTSDSCNGVRFFRCILGFGKRLTDSRENLYLKYRCSNCQKSEKTYALQVKLLEHGNSIGELSKFGEMPVFGPPTASKLIKLIGPDRDDFLKGRRCESQGLGVGAFIYYRRVVENQTNRILNEILKASKKLSAPQEKIVAIERAITETQFSKALDAAKDMIPESLLINGHSPIKLLHSALSQGVHALTDDQCLELASSIRIVLGELSERLSQVLKDEVELTKALSTLMKIKGH